MNSPVHSYKDRQMQDLDSHAQGCGVFSLFFLLLAFGVFLCGLINGSPEGGLCAAGIVLIIGAIVIGLSFKEFLKKQKNIKK